MVTDLEQVKGDKETWRFSLLVYWGGFELKVRGWNFWPDSGEVKPPRYNAYGSWKHLVEFPSAKSEIVRKVKEALEGLKKSAGEDSKERKYSDEQLQEIVDSGISLEDAKESFLLEKELGNVTDWDWERFVELGGFNGNS